MWQNIKLKNRLNGFSTTNHFSFLLPDIYKNKIHLTISRDGFNKMNVLDERQAYQQKHN